MVDYALLSLVSVIRMSRSKARLYVIPSLQALGFLLRFVVPHHTSHDPLLIALLAISNAH